MRRNFSLFFILILCLNQLSAQVSESDKQQGLRANRVEESKVMSEAYWKLWNQEVQAKIDRDIEQYRKADAVFRLKGVSTGTEVKVEQISHDFIFGAHIFNFNQLGTA